MEKQDRQWMISEAYNDLVKQIRRDLKDDILDDIEKRTDQMRKVLDNGAPIWRDALGERHDRIFNARQKVWTKLHILNEMYGTIVERY